MITLQSVVLAEALNTLRLDPVDILHRIDVLERDLYWHGVIATAVFAVLGLGTVGTFFRLWSTVKAKVHDEVEKRAHEADGLISQAKAEIAELKQSVGTKVIIESDVIEFRFGVAPFNYASHTVRFKTKFTQIPQVFVSEANAGDWVYAKVDSVELDRFVWAARPLTGHPTNPERVVRLNWAAIYTEVLSMDEPMDLLASDKKVQNA